MIILSLVIRQWQRQIHIKLVHHARNQKNQNSEGFWWPVQPQSQLQETGSQWRKIVWSINWNWFIDQLGDQHHEMKTNIAITACWCNWCLPLCYLPCQTKKPAAIINVDLWLPMLATKTSTTVPPDPQKFLKYYSSPQYSTYQSQLSVRISKHSANMSCSLWSSIIPTTPLLQQ